MTKFNYLLAFFLLISIFSSNVSANNPPYKTKETKNNTIKVLFAYTTRAAIQAGGVSELKKSVENGLRLLNEGLQNSNIGYTAVAIAEFVEVTSEDQPSNQEQTTALLAELRKKDGKYNKIHQFRQEKQGDIVCLIFSGYTMGIADSFNGAIKSGEFMVCHYTTFGESYVFPHEFGHNLGAQHGNNPKYNFKVGNNKYRTISNNGGVAVPYFSENRTVQHTIDGKKQTISLGDANYDNAKIMRKVAPLTAQLGENLTSVPSASNAYSAKLVNPATASMPSGTKQISNVTNVRLNNGCLVIEYSTKDAGRFQIKKLVDADGNETQLNGGYDPSLKPNETKAELCAGFVKGDKVELLIDGTKTINVVLGEPFNAGSSSSSTAASSNSSPTTNSSASSSVSDGYALEIMSGNEQSYGGGGMPFPMVIKIKNSKTNVDVADWKAEGITVEVVSSKEGKYDGAFNNYNNACKNGDKACYGGYYYVESNSGKSPYTLTITVNVKKDGKTVASTKFNQNIK